MTSRGLGLAVLGLLAGAAAPFACGGNAFEAGPGDGGPTVDSSVEGGPAPDSMAADGPGDGHTDAANDGPATADGPSSDGVAPAPDGGATIVGTVLDQNLLPMAGVDVHAQTQRVTTASDGTFTLVGLVTPYTLTVVTTPAGGHRHGYVFVNATRKNPTLQLTADTAGQPQSTTAAGHLAANATGASGVIFADFAAGIPAAFSNAIPIAPGATTYSGPLAWFGAPSVTATMYTLQWLSANGLPTSYIAYASQSEPLTAGTPLAWDTPTSTIIASQATLSVTLGTSSGYVPTAIGLYARPPGAQIAAPIANISTFVTSSGSFVTPDITGMTFVACGVQAPAGTDAGAGAAFGAACDTGLAADAKPTLALPPAPVLLGPPATATIGSVFDFQPMSSNSSVYLVAFAPAGNSPGDALYVVTNATQVKIPDLSGFGFTVPTGSTYGVEVYGFSPFAVPMTIDAALSPTGFSSMATALQLDRGPSANGQVASSGVATFTAQ
jgi:hypothetical protein